MNAQEPRAFVSKRNPGARKGTAERDHSGLLFVIDTVSGEIVSQFRVGHAAGALAVESTANRAYVAVPGGIATVDLSGNGLVSTVTVPGRVTALAARGDAVYAFSTRYGDQGVVAALSVARAGQVVKTIDFDGVSGDLALTPDGTRLYLTLADSRQSIVALDTRTDSIVAEVQADDDIGWPARVVVAPAVPDPPVPVATRGPPPPIPVAAGYRVHGVTLSTISTIDGATGETLHTLRFSSPSRRFASGIVLSADGGLSVADAWIAATAVVRRAVLVHKDPEFRSLSHVAHEELPR